MGRPSWRQGHFIDRFLEAPCQGREAAGPWGNLDQKMGILNDGVTHTPLGAHSSCVQERLPMDDLFMGEASKDFPW